MFTKGHIGSIFERAKNGNSQEHSVMLMIIRNISEKCPAILVEFFPSLCDGAIFKEDSVTTRSAVIAAIAVENKVKTDASHKKKKNNKMVFNNE